jgi:hypothetical protein
VMLPCPIICRVPSGASDTASQSKISILPSTLRTVAETVTVDPGRDAAT